LSHKIDVIHCSMNRCTDCSERIDDRCQKLNSMKNNPNKTVALVEPTRGLIHLWFPESGFPLDAPWYSEGWESVFIGANDDFFDCCYDLIDICLVEPYLCVFMNQHDDSQFIFQSRPLVKTSLELSLLNTLIEEFRFFTGPSQSIREGVSSQQQRITDEVLRHLQVHIPEINDNSGLRLSQIVAHSTCILGRIIPILSDELTEEIYLDGPENPIYFDHQIHGRCITQIMYTDNEIPRITTFIRAESNQHLDRANPSVKMDLNFLGNALRLSASIPPLSMSALSLEIRRARRNPYSIKSLIQNGTVTPEAAALLILAVVSRLNITITGGPGTGKTTLLNALDMITPQWWRKIYIEDAIESKSLSNQHQVRLQVDSIDEHHNRLNKSEEIVKCLHRSPDYIILGEIQTAEHSQALFQAISAGLRTIQTCHSDSASGLISRWVLSHGIENSSLGLMDIIVTLEKPRPGESHRQVKEIVEIRKEVKDGLLVFTGLNTIYDVTHSSCINFAQDGTIQNLARSIGVTEWQRGINDFIEIIRRTSEIVEFERIGDELWSYGHPMEFTGYQSK
jgi:type IV secretory pathway ATPase VirB11/archaellum biosynthesis ATPase